MRPNLTVKHDQPLLKLLPRQTIHTYLVYHSTPLEANGKPHKEEGTITCKIITGQLAATEVKINFLCEVVRPDICITTNKIDLPTLQID